MPKIYGHKGKIGLNGRGRGAVGQSFVHQENFSLRLKYARNAGQDAILLLLLGCLVATLVIVFIVFMVYLRFAR